MPFMTPAPLLVRPVLVGPCSPARTAPSRAAFVLSQPRPAWDADRVLRGPQACLPPQVSRTTTAVTPCCWTWWRRLGRPGRMRWARCRHSRRGCAAACCWRWCVGLRALLALLLCAPSSWSADADLSYLQSRVFRVNNGNCVHLLMSSLTMMCGLMAHLPTTDTAVDRHPACHCVHMLTATLPITVRCRLASSQTSSSRSQRRPTSRPTRPSSCSPTASAGPRLRLATGC